jgi:putative oxidoreductase
MAQREGGEMIPYAGNYLDLALLAIRIMVAIEFLTSGWNHATKSAERGKSIGMSRQFTMFLGVAEMAGALGVLLGFLSQFAALGLILIMLGAIQRKMFVWKTGFWGPHGTDGWHYDLLFVAMCLVILTTDGGRFVIFH